LSKQTLPAGEGRGDHAVPEMRLRFDPEAEGECESLFCGTDAAGLSDMATILCLRFEEVNCRDVESGSGGGKGRVGYLNGR